MSRQLLLASLTALAVVFLAPLPAAGQAADNWTPARTQDGHPDLQGYWTTQTFTPLERPEYLGDKKFYTEEEWSELQAQLKNLGIDVDLSDVQEEDDYDGEIYRYVSVGE